MKIGVGPKGAEDWTDFLKLVAARSENFLVVHVAAPAAQKGKFMLAQPKTKLVGRAALLHEFKQVEAKLAGALEGQISMADLRVFKMFGWLLDKGQMQQAMGWIGKVSEQAQDLLAITFGKGSSESKVEVAGGLAANLLSGAASSSRSSSSSSSGHKSKAMEAQQAKKDEVRSSMLKFFNGKKATA